MIHPSVRPVFRMVALGLMWSVLVGALFAQEAKEPVFVRVTGKVAGTVVGEWQSETASQINLLDIKTNQAVTIPKSDVTRVENPLPINDAARAVGLSPVTSRIVSRMATQQSLSGKIAKVSPQAVYVTLGKASGLTVGQKLTVNRKVGEVIDPDTGAILATEKSLIAELEVIEVEDKVCRAKLVGNLDAKLEVGDLAEAVGSQFVVAVCPPTNDDGTASPTGSGLAEELTAALVQRGVTVVERSALDMVLSELLKQNSALFDETQAQQLGKLTGASVVLTGKVVTDKSTATAHLRLVDVTTAKILAAISSPVKVRNLAESGNTGAKATDKWNYVFPPRDRKGVEPFPNRPDLTLKGFDSGNIKTFTVNGSFSVQGNRCLLTQGQQAAITLLKEAKNFELDANIDMGDVGGMFLLVGWKEESGTITKCILNRRSVWWGSSTIANGATVEGSTVGHNGTDRLPGPQRVFLKVQDSKLSLMVGQVQICKDHPIPNDSGDVVLGTFATQYGPKVVAVHSLRWRPQ